MSKPKIAIFSFTGCEGCSLQILNCEDKLPELFGHFDIVNFREAISNRTEDYQIAFVDGAITTPADEEEIIHIRSKAGMVVPIGACACTGGLNVMKNFKGLDYCLKRVYGDKAGVFKTIDARPVDAVVDVDFKIPGCPIDRDEFLRVVTALLMGRQPQLPDYPVCVECKLRGNVCQWLKGNACMGIVARAGCNAICPSFGSTCVACRGLIDEPNENACKEVMEEHGLTMEQVLAQFQLYNGYYDVAKQP